MSDFPQSGGSEADHLIESIKEHDRVFQMARTAFERAYAREYKPPKEPGKLAGRPWAMIPFGVLGFLGSFLSALRTAPVFSYVAARFSNVAEGVVLPALMTTIEGVVATLVVDGAAIAFRFAMVVYNNDGNSKIEVSKWVNRGFWLAFIAQVVGNLYATMGVATGLTGEVRNLAELAIAIVTGLSGVVIAFATGDILGHQWLGSKKERQQIEDEYKFELAAWKEKREGMWSRRKASYGVAVAVDGASVSARTKRTERTARTGENADELPRTVLQVVEHLSANPGDARLSVRDLAERVGVGKTSAASGRNAYLEQVGPSVLSSNGHSNGHNGVRGE
jgi:uncharacterized membrane protein